MLSWCSGAVCLARICLSATSTIASNLCFAFSRPTPSSRTLIMPAISALILLQTYESRWPFSSMFTFSSNSINLLFKLSNMPRCLCAFATSRIVSILSASLLRVFASSSAGLLSEWVLASRTTPSVVALSRRGASAGRCATTVAMRIKTNTARAIVAAIGIWAVETHAHAPIASETADVKTEDIQPPRKLVHICERSWRRMPQSRGPAERRGRWRVRRDHMPATWLGSYRASTG